jgi:hypothetical protein
MRVNISDAEDHETAAMDSPTMPGSVRTAGTGKACHGSRDQGAIFYEGDAMSVFWSPVLKRFVLISKSVQPWKKTHHRPRRDNQIDSNDGTMRFARRVLMIRTSPDGRNWTPSDDLPDIYDLHGKKAAHPPEWLIMPDAEDPPDLEFYSGNAFWYHDRAYMMVLNYAASPMLPKNMARNWTMNCGPARRHEMGASCAGCERERGVQGQHEAHRCRDHDHEWQAAVAHSTASWSACPKTGSAV